MTKTEYCKNHPAMIIIHGNNDCAICFIDTLKKLREDSNEKYITAFNAKYGATLAEEYRAILKHHGEATSPLYYSEVKAEAARNLLRDFMDKYPVD